MLKKLIRYEWKAVSGINALLAAVASGVCLLGLIYMQTPMWKEMWKDSFIGGFNVGLWLIGMGGLFVYLIMLVGVMFAQMIYFGVRYYNSMFSNQGYLTHTLPVTPEELLISKVVTAGGWTFLINLLLIVLSVTLMAVGIIGTGVSDITIGEILKMLLEGIWEFFDNWKEMLLPILTLLLNPFLSAAILFGALTIGHYSGKNKGLMGILSYFGVMVVRSILKNMLNMLLESASYWERFDNMALGRSHFYRNLQSSLLADILLAAGLMIWARHILKKRLNMD